MEFTVATKLSEADLVQVENALRQVDPAALVDADAHGLRVAGAFDVATLAALLSDAGLAVSPQDIRIVPSVCCGGCSG